MSQYGKIRKNITDLVVDSILDHSNDRPVCMLIAESTWRQVTNFYVDSTIIITFDDFEIKVSRG